MMHEIESVEAFVERGSALAGTVVQGLDLSAYGKQLLIAEVDGAIFLGCEFGDESLPCHLLAKGALLFPRFPDIPYRPYRNALYTREELMEGWSEEKDESVDLKIYEHFIATGKHRPSIAEALTRRIHDHAIDDALGDLLNQKERRRVVGIMGGHSTRRNDHSYHRVVTLTRDLAKRGYFVASGGGPGIMEAANLGAYLANTKEEELAWVFETLVSAPRYDDPGFNAAALKVLERFPQGVESLAIPTWFYGHEPSNLFSAHIAKYFSNSIREDGLLAISQHGVVFAPGSAGTVQEVFMDLCQNHYETHEFASPMVFLDRTFYERNGVLSVVEHMAGKHAYKDLVLATDSPAEAADFIASFQPKQDT